MKIVRYSYENQVQLGILQDEEIFPLSLGPHTTPAIPLLHRKRDELASDALSSKSIPVEDARLLAPIRRPGKIVCLGRNYVAHAEESGMPVPEEPIIFAKASSAVTGPGGPIVHHKICTRVDHEVELAVVIGDQCRYVRGEDALEKVLGYTVINDVTARDMQKRDIESRNPWFRSKSLDTFCPLGPWIVTSEEIPDPQRLSLECRVNGEVRQHGNTREMIFPVTQLIEFISAHMTLEPGDIIATGTPEGISPIRPGDVVECEVEGIGVLRNPVIDDPQRGS